MILLIGVPYVQFGITSFVIKIYFYFLNIWHDIFPLRYIPYTSTVKCSFDTELLKQEVG